jgi:hypothetical protein
LKRLVSKIHLLAASPPLVVAVSFAAAIAVVTVLAQPSEQSNVSLKYGLIAAILLVLAVLNLYSVFIRKHNLALKRSWGLLGDINQIYKSSLSKAFVRSSNPLEVSELEDIFTEEEQTLKAVLQRIEAIFHAVIDRECLVTLKLTTQDETGLWAHTYVRSKDRSDRDYPTPLRYSIGTGLNTGFDTALRHPKSGRPNHFYSPDLLTEPQNYKNERPNFSIYYRSTLVVPLASRIPEPLDGTTTVALGFLSVDSQSSHRLNSSYHLDLLVGLADQMYNYISLMRGTYQISKTESNEK